MAHFLARLMSSVGFCKHLPSPNGRFDNCALLRNVIKFKFGRCFHTAELTITVDQNELKDMYGAIVLQKTHMNLNRFRPIFAV